MAPREATVIGVDFAGPSLERDQRRKIIAIAAHSPAPGRYVIRPTRFNERLLSRPAQPGWTAHELARWLLTEASPEVVALDFPSSIPRLLLEDPAFARAAGAPRPFRSWTAFNRFVADRLKLEPPLDLSAFAAWRSKDTWKKRATDRPAGAQPALKDRFQVLFNMTLLGNAFLAALAASGRYSILPFQEGGANPRVIEIYPGLTMRRLGFPRYKRAPADAIRCVLAYSAARGVNIVVDPAVRAFCETYTTRPSADPDASDALIAVATGILYREGFCAPVIDPGDEHYLPFEGCIWAPHRA